MANSSILGGTRAPAEPAGKDIDSLGPSDTSDSGSDVRTDPPRNVSTDESSEGALSTEHGSTGDAAGTGERAVLGAAVPTQDTASRMDRQAGRSVSSSSGCDESLRSLHGDWRAFLQSNRGPPSCVVCRSAGVADDGGEGG